MRHLVLIFIFLLLSNEGIIAQTDSMIVEFGSGVKKYSIAEISEITFSPVTSISEDELAKMNEILNSFALNQNYPNPFNPSTNISYRIPQSGQVSVIIYDVNGSFVKEIFSAPQEAGEHSVVWDSKDQYGASVSSGVYFYQIKFNSSSQTKKMIYLK